MPEFVPTWTANTKDPMICAYLECAEWTETGDGQNASGRKWSVCAVTQAEETCRIFRQIAGPRLDGWSATQVGRDLWLSRNRHGAGYQDRKFPHAEALAELARSFGERSVWIGSHGTAHFD